MRIRLEVLVDVDIGTSAQTVVDEVKSNLQTVDYVREVEVKDITYRKPDQRRPMPKE